MKVRHFLLTSCWVFFSLIIGLNWPRQVQAQFNLKAGVHILHPGELEDARRLLTTLADGRHFVTITLALSDLEKPQEWKTFFEQAKILNLTPIIRLVTKFENGAWAKPTRSDIIKQISFLSNYEWPSEERLLIIYNEPNHAAEFGGEISPKQYAQILRFASDWARTENKNYKILPAGLDLAAPNGRITMEAFTFLSLMYEADPDIFEVVDYWNSHSYPNPGFIAAPYQTGKNSVSGFKYELAFVKKLSGKEFPVYITETGWLSNSLTNRWLETYYQYAVRHIWSDERVRAVTPFLLHGDPGAFAGFSFLDRTNQPTKQFSAYQKAILTDLPK